jgi:hypothetical protein
MQYITMINDWPYTLLFTCDCLFLFQIIFWMIFVLPTQVFFNALICFHVTTKKPRPVSTAEIAEQTNNPSSTDFMPPSRQWKSFRLSFSRRCSSSVRFDPLAAVVAPAPEEDELQDLEEEKSTVEQSKRNGATEGSWIPSDPVGMELGHGHSNGPIEN